MSCSLGLVQFVGRQRRQRVQIGRKSGKHPDSGRGEAVAPAPLLAEGAGNERRKEGPDIDSDIEDRIRPIPACVANWIERATWVEMFGLNAPLPRMSMSSPRKNSRSHISRNCP